MERDRADSNERHSGGDANTQEVTVDGSTVHSAVVSPIPHSYLLSPYVLGAADPQVRYQKAIRLVGILFLAGGLLASMVTLAPGHDLYASPRGISTLGLIAILIGAVILGLPRLITPLHLYFACLAAITLTTLGTHFAGPQAVGFAAMLYIWQTSLAFCFLRRRWVIPTIAMVAVGFAIVVALDAPGPTYAFNAWLFTMGTVIVTASFIGLLVQDLHASAASERLARTETEVARDELFALNRDLEDRVNAKIVEVERLSELRRLVSSHVAEALLGSDKALAPHRREIAVFFIDLRGFTKFAADCDAEEVIQVLDSFYSVLGRSFRKFDATVGAFEADGVMAYFNDPVPIENPAQQAIDMAIDLRGPMNQLVERWHARGYELHFGVGVALGFATMGLVGFEGRQDYTAIGTVVNLASRLCDEAQRGEILLDRKVRQMISDDLGVEEIAALPLKGFRDPVPAFRLLQPGTVRDRPSPS